MIWIDSPDEDAYTRKVKINNRILRPETVAELKKHAFTSVRDYSLNRYIASLEQMFPR